MVAWNAFSLVAENFGMAIAVSIPVMTMTISNSINVTPRRVFTVKPSTRDVRSRNATWLTAAARLLSNINFFWIIGTSPNIPVVSKTAIGARAPPQLSSPLHLHARASRQTAEQWYEPSRSRHASYRGLPGYGHPIGWTPPVPRAILGIGKANSFYAMKVNGSNA